ncbi:MAG: hypothetical protein WC782_06435 [Methylococcaceae bacterium]|jgi:hypothetical protein
MALEAFAMHGLDFEAVVATCYGGIVVVISLFAYVANPPVLVELFLVNRQTILANLVRMDAHANQPLPVP